jgi:chitodextrinase
VLKKLIVGLVAAVLGLAWSGSALAYFHLWRINEIYSNADGTVQFLELNCASPSCSSETVATAAPITITPAGGGSNHVFNFPTNLVPPNFPAPPALNQKLLLATQGFANLGVVTPNFIIPDGFLFINGGTINFGGFDIVPYSALPTDGVLSVSRAGVTATNSPTNFAGATGSVTPPADATPDAFSFTPVTGAALSAGVESNAITVAGINTAATISITGGEYSINSGSYTAAAGTVANGNTVKVRLTASASPGALASATLTIGGVSAAFDVTTAAPDTTAPTVPGSLTATAVSSSQIDLAWAASSDAVGVTAYHVFRDGVQIQTLGSATLAYNDTGLAPSTLYNYGVRACDAAGNCSAQATAPATTQAPPDTQAPTVPGSFTATPVSSSKVDLAWTASSDAVGVAAYHVFRGGVQIATLGSATLSFSDSGLTAATLYNYGVRACDAAGNCSVEANASATTLAPGMVIGSGARAQFEGFRDGPAADTFIDFNSTPVGALTTQIGGLTFQSNIDTAGNPFGPIEAYVSTAPQCTVRCIVGTPFAGGSDDGRVGYQILFATPQRRAGLQRIWNAQTVTRFYNESNQLLAEHVGSGFVGFIAVGSDSPTQWVKRIQVDGLIDPGDMITRQVGYSDDLFFGSAAVGPTFTADLELGFNLISNSLDITLNVPATFGNQDAPVAGVTENVVTLWKWNAVDGRWAFYSPQLSAAAIASFASSKGYDVLSTINPGEGYWVNALNAVTLPAQTGAPYNWTPATFAILPSGFNLIAHTDERTPSEFNIDVSPTPPAPGTVPTTNFLTLWVWDAAAAKWYFYSPLLESSGGLAAVKAHADSHFYLHFQDDNKKIGLGVGFWVNRP